MDIWLPKCSLQFTFVRSEVHSARSFVQSNGKAVPTAVHTWRRFCNKMHIVPVSGGVSNWPSMATSVCNVSSRESRIGETGSRSLYSMRMMRLFVYTLELDGGSSFSCYMLFNHVLLKLRIINILAVSPFVRSFVCLQIWIDDYETSKFIHIACSFTSHYCLERGSLYWYLQVVFVKHLRLCYILHSFIFYCIVSFMTFLSK